MSQNGFYWENAIAIPFADRIHEVVWAFLRTSQFGIWSIDTAEPNDSFVMHFRRGDWRRGFVGFKLRRRLFAPGMRLSEIKENPDRTPMRLRVAIRPSPAVAKITLRHEATIDPLFAFLGTVVKAEAIVARQVDKEVHAFSAYLRECYGLSEPPVIESP